MKKVILICGKLCSGKSYYARQLKQQLGAVILSTDEATYDLICNEQGEFYNVFAQRVNRYLRKKATEIVLAGADVILDWGFWTRADRQDITDYFTAQSIPMEWHYVDVGEQTWQAQIALRNGRIQAGEGGWDFFIDEGLMQKLLSRFEPPTREEIDVWHTNP